MKLKNALKFIAAPSRVFMTLVILLFVLFIVQLITIELIEEAERVFERETAKKEPAKQSIFSMNPLRDFTWMTSESS